MNHKFKRFMRSKRLSIGYLISQKIKNEESPFNPVLTRQLTNISYNRDKNSVSIISI